MKLIPCAELVGVNARLWIIGVNIADCFKNNLSGKEGCTGIKEKGEYEYGYIGRCDVLVWISAFKEGQLYFTVVELWY